jgi:glycosyltransferase involved in cell wall biosynthesis
MDLTIAICTWNRSADLRQTLEHMTRLRLPSGTEWEILVVNNNCTDDTDAVCSAFVGRLPIRVLHEPTPGQSYARNLAIREATGTYICWTDDDVLVEPDWLAALLRAFERSNADWVFGASEPSWPGAPPAWYAPRFRGNFAVLDYGQQPFRVTDANHPFYGLNFAGTKAAHVQLGGFRTEFGFRGTSGGIGEDVDMFERALRANMQIVYTPDARVSHVIPPARTRKQYHRRRQWVAAPVYFQHMGEFFGGVPWLLGLPRFLYSNALRSLGGYAQSTWRRDRSERFFHELQLVRFAALMRAAAKGGFRRARPDRTGTAQTVTR